MHADLSQRAVVATGGMYWTPRAGGIDEKLLELAGPRRTALVRLAPGIPLPPDDGIVDVLVLSGELRDRDHVYPAGTFLHGIAGQRAIAAASPCVAFVKHRPAGDGAFVAIDTSRVAYRPGDWAGLELAPLHVDPHGVVALLRFAPGTKTDVHTHDDGEEFFVLDGAVRDELGTYAKHDWVRQPSGSRHAVDSPNGCLFLTFAHHLAC